ncbi:hypothetical protein DPMN_132656 [Dreissena polymorpha]|uniref:Myb/SANT-like DNA-binding domain-containing protein n=1 Tax=Dreissena polymorpha TaxID=45954 RepID=A0A9D4FTT2_DREPO|nr:hypothetical protein DPMN_132656 [Dreissena polymorpha]
MEAAKKRKMHWSANEINALVDGFVEYQEVLEGKLSNQLTSKVKLELYEKLTESINSQSLTQRSVEEVKKKLSDIKTDVRQQERKILREARATRGGPAIADLNDWQEKLLSALPKVSNEGFPRIDNFKESPESSKFASTSSKRKNADVEKGSAPEKGRYGHGKVRFLGRTSTWCLYMEELMNAP